jgi:hypothetical protein
MKLAKYLKNGRILRIIRVQTKSKSIQGLGPKRRFRGEIP